MPLGCKLFVFVRECLALSVSQSRYTTFFAIMSAMASACRIASVTMVKVGFSAPPVCELAAVGYEEVRDIVGLPELVNNAVPWLFTHSAGAKIVR